MDFCKVVLISYRFLQPRSGAMFIEPSAKTIVVSSVRSAMFLSPINGLTHFNMVLVVYKHFVPPALNQLRHTKTLQRISVERIGLPGHSVPRAIRVSDYL